MNEHEKIIEWLKSIQPYHAKELPKGKGDNKIWRDKIRRHGKKDGLSCYFQKHKGIFYITIYY